jgi:predicted HTH domain antitoxin
MKVITLRIPQDVLEKIDEIARRENKERSEVVREILKIGLKDKLVEDALKMYREGKVSMWKASKMAGVSLWEFIEILKDRGVEIQYRIRELEEDVS